VVNMLSLPKNKIKNVDERLLTIHNYNKVYSPGYFCLAVKRKQGRGYRILVLFRVQNIDS
jgi:hypothetical protein